MEKIKISVENVNKCFNKKIKGQEVYALDIVNFTVKQGEFFCILGPSGCGKSTLLNVMAGFERPTNGKVLINGQEVLEPNPKYVTMFQDNALFAWRSVIDNVAYGLEIQGIEENQRKSIAMKYIRLVGLLGFEDKHPSELSGGMKQRVQLARTLAVNPDIIFMDEPFGALDPITRDKLQEELIRIWQEEKKTIVFVTHNVSEAVALADRVAIMSSSPGSIRKIIDINIQRPRVKFSSEFLRLEEEIFEEFDK